MYGLKARLVFVLAYAFRLVSFPLQVALARTWRGRCGVLLNGLSRFSFVALVPPLILYHSNLVSTLAFANLLLTLCILLFFIGCISHVASKLAIYLTEISLTSRLPRGGPMESHFLGKPYHCESIWVDAALEDANVWMLILCITHLDPFMPRDERMSTRAAFRRTLGALAADAAYRGLSRISISMSRVLGNGRLDPKHCYSYCAQPHVPGELLGMLVFLHGHGTNLLAVVHLLRPLADRLRVVLIAPTFGYGNWEAPGGVKAIERAIDFGLKSFAVDQARVFLAGLSQGGAGVSRAAAANPHRYAGLIFISATMELPVLNSEVFAIYWKGKPVLVIHGDRDRNVSPRSVMAAVESMLVHGARVTLLKEPNSGHFLFFAKLEEMENVIADWAERVAEGGVETTDAPAIPPGV